MRDARLRVVFAGTPAFSVLALDALHAAGHEIVGVYTQPDRPAGRGQKLSASPVAERAVALGLPLFKPVSFKKEPEALAALQALQADVMVVVAYGLILPQAVLDAPRYGCLNIHASLLPRWRGAAPIQRALLAGDTETGITIMQMDAGLDTGPMLIKRSVRTAGHTAGSLHDVLAKDGAELIVQALADLASGALQPQVQPPEGVTYASKLSKEEARLDFSKPAAALALAIRGYNPVPMAWAMHGDERIKIFAAEALAEQLAPADVPVGSVLAADAQGLLIATGAGCLRITSLQRPGGKPQTAGQFHSARDWRQQVFA